MLSSRSCELATVDELEEDLEERDPEFVRFSRQFIQNLQKVDRIVPFLRAWVPEFRCLVGFLVSLDGGKAGYGSTIHALAGKEEANQEGLCENQHLAGKVKKKVINRSDPTRDDGIVLEQESVNLSDQPQEEKESKVNEGLLRS